MPIFEFDPGKSAQNQAKHGIDFVEAQALWRDPDRLEVPARSTSEPRWQLLARLQQTLWSAFFTYRHEDTIRLISVRRARHADDLLCALGLIEAVQGLRQA